MGDSVRVMVVGRSVGTSQYRGVGRGHSGRADGAERTAGHRWQGHTLIGTQVVSSLHFAANADYVVRMQLSGASPTQIRMRGLAGRLG